MAVTNIAILYLWGGYYVQLNNQYDCYHPLLPMFHIVPIPVRFHPATYFVTEGVNSYAEITLEVTKIPKKSFSVYVNTRDGSADGEHHAIHSLWTNLFSIIAHSYMYNIVFCALLQQ